MFQFCSLPLGKVGEYHIIATTIAGNGDVFPIMSTHDLKGVRLEIYPLAEGITWEIFHEKGYHSGDLLVFVEKQLPSVRKFFLPNLKRKCLNWGLFVPGITEELITARPTLYLTIGHRDYVFRDTLKAPFEVAGDNTQLHDHSVYPPKPPRALPRDRKECEHND